MRFRPHDLAGQFDSLAPMVQAIPPMAADRLPQGLCEFVGADGLLDPRDRDQVEVAGYGPVDRQSVAAALGFVLEQRVNTYVDRGRVYVERHTQCRSPKSSWAGALSRTSDFMSFMGDTLSMALGMSFLILSLVS